MEISEFLALYPTKNIQRRIFEKYEFYDLELPSQDIDNNIVGGKLLPHQLIISRYLSAYTPYTGILLYHEVGTGKTCSAIATIENLRTIKDSMLSFEGAIILAKGQNLLDNIVYELAHVCTQGQYLPSEEIIDPAQRIRIIKRNIGNFYTFDTFEMFIKKIRKMNDTEIRKKYSRHVIVIDEAHNLRPGERKIERLSYAQMHRFLHVMIGSKILLMTATPMKDNPNEISAIMNLILPLNMQLQIGSKFQNTYLVNNPNGSLTVNPSKIPELKEYFKGRVSYLKSQQSTVRKQFVGMKIPPLNHFIVYSFIYNNFQKEYYLNAYKRDMEKREGFFQHSRQAALFVFPDGSYGKTGSKKYIKEIKIRGGSIYSLSQDLKNSLNFTSNNDQEKLTALDKFSNKYAFVIEQIISNLEHLTFVYSDSIDGSGIILFSKILEMFGYTQATGNETKPGKRYALITSKTVTVGSIKTLIRRFNNPDNMTGTYIQVLIGSRLISEGFSLKNVRQVFVLTPFWNFSETEQAIARAIRLFSHRDLERAGIDVTVKIYLLVSLLNNLNDNDDDEISSLSIIRPNVPFIYTIDNIASRLGIDMGIYVIAENKDVSIKSIEKVIKEVAFDCLLTKKRNLYGSEDYSRRCQYDLCNYECNDDDDEDFQINLPQNLDYSSYKLYYEKPEHMNEIEQIIRNMFLLQFAWPISILISKIQQKGYLDFTILGVIHYLVYASIFVKNKYGFQCYIRENNNILFLTQNINFLQNASAAEYIENPCLIEPLEFSQIIRKQMKKSYVARIDSLCISSTISERIQIVTNFPIIVQEAILETLILFQKTVSFSQPTGVLEKSLRNFFNPFLYKIDNNFLRESISTSQQSSFVEDGINIPFRFTNMDNSIIVSTLLYPSMKQLRCLSAKTWKICDNDETEKVIFLLQQNVSHVESNLYYGIIEQSTGKFRIVSSPPIVGRQEEMMDKRLIRRGRECKSWKIHDLLRIAMHLGIQEDYQENITINEEKLTQLLITDPIVKKMYETYIPLPRDIVTEINNMDINGRHRLLSLSKAKKSRICDLLQQHMIKNNLIKYIL